MKGSRAWLWLLLLIPVAVGLVRLRLDVEVLNLLPTSLPVVQGLKTYQERFAHGQHLIVTLRGPSSELSEQTARDLAWVLREHPGLVRGVVWQPPFMEDPAQSGEMLAYLWYNSEEFTQLTNRLIGVGLTNALVAMREELATTLSPRQLAWGGYDPFGLAQPPRAGSGSRFDLQEAEGLFASADGTFRVVFVEPAPDLTQYRECVRWMDTVQTLIGDAQHSGRLSAQVALSYTGRPAFVREIAGGMERDMVASVTGTMVIIVILFYLWHRRWRPLLWLLGLLGLVLTATLGLGGLVFGNLNVVSMGFAAILLGLAADYALVLYQEAVDSPQARPSDIRRSVGPGIAWSALTTALAFAILQFTQLPGLAQLGALVAMGVAVAAGLILHVYLPPLLPIPQRKRPGAPGYLVFPQSAAWLLTGAIVSVSGFLLVKDRPRFDHTADALKPRDSEAYAAVEEIKYQLAHPDEPLWVVIPGTNTFEVAERLIQLHETLARAQSNGLIAGFTLPIELWPRIARQQSNRPTALLLAEQTNHLQQVAGSLGFAPSALQLSLGMISDWARATQEEVFWPTNPASKWVLESVVATDPTRPLALALVYPPVERSGRENAIMQLARTWPENLKNHGVILAGWELLGHEVFDMVSADVPGILLAMTLLLLPALSLAFRAVKEVLLSLATLVGSALALWIVMDLAGWSFNLMNMMALPLLLGAGVDYSIHIQLAMRRHNGDATKTRRTTGWALLLCAATTFAAFGSLGFSSNAGLASLGQVCAAGIACAWIVAVGLLPAWWSAGRVRSPTL